jgi:hypothetical protein
MEGGCYQKRRGHAFSAALCLSGILFEVQVRGAACQKQVLRFAQDDKNLRAVMTFA